MADEGRRLILVDGHAMLYRAFFAFPQSLTTRKGELINAVYGFTSTLLNVIRDLKPTHIAMSFDIGETFRHKEYPEYKAHREKMPEELKEQEPRAYEVVEALNIPLYVKEGFEADDVIGSLAKQASELVTINNKQEPIKTLIVTGDMDAMQLVREGDGKRGEVHVFVPGRANKPALEYGTEQVVSKYSLTPEQIIDYKALAGDSSDNIPGIRGIGKVGATKLLRAFGDLDRIYKAVDLVLDEKTSTETQKSTETQILKGALLEKLKVGRESTYESRGLVTIVRDVPVELDLGACEVRQYDKEKVVELFEELEFNTLLKRLPDDEFEENVQEALF